MDDERANAVAGEAEDGRYRFFQNRECEYFPCHAVANEENFNCLFCYCPLYALGRHCGGAFRYTEKGVKNCADCAFPHRRENYEAVLRRYGEISAVIRAVDAMEDLGNRTEE